MKISTSYTQLAETIRALGLAGGVVCLHSSLKSFGHLAGGADTLIRAFLDQGCTLIVPTFTYGGAPPPPGRQIQQNGPDHEAQSQAKNVPVYDKNSTLIEHDMGAIPARLLQMPGRVRGDHDMNSFSALGPLADELIGEQSLLNVYGPLKALLSRPSAWLALVGVNLTKATPIHLAEERAGRRLFRRWARNTDGVIQEMQVGSCSEGFNNFAPVVREIETNVTVGESKWRVYPFGAFIDVVTAAIMQNPKITHCSDPYCARCNDAVRGGPLL